MAQTQSQAGQEGQAPQMSMQEAIAQLEARLIANPNDVDGHMLYARSQISMQNYAKAVTAYRKSNELAPNEAVILTELAEAIALFNNNRSFLGEPEGYLAEAVALDPNNQKALWLLGMTYYEHKDYAKTDELWTQLYRLMDDEGAKQQLSEQLEDVRNKLELDTTVVQTTETAETIIKASDLNENVNSENTNSMTSITLHISLADSLKENLLARPALLYIYAKAVSGMPMPIAVIKKPLEQIIKSFPLSLSLSDDNNLQATRKLSDFDSIIIGARISFSGNAMPQAGDLQSTELKIDLPYADTLELVIDKTR
ncbi:MAG: hypothetical protein JKX98_12330 [Alcanivoracaceae bacterium]|nr:hypothetical protein [Alcanivoracaceae bacterium]